MWDILCLDNNRRPAKAEHIDKEAVRRAGAGERRVTATIDDIRELVALQLGLDKVGARDRLVEELGAESADVVNVIAAVEDRYGVAIDEAEIPDLRSAADLFERLQSRL